MKTDAAVEQFQLRLNFWSAMNRHKFLALSQRLGKWNYLVCITTDHYMKLPPVISTHPSVNQGSAASSSENPESPKNPAAAESKYLPVEIVNKILSEAKLSLKEQKALRSTSKDFFKLARIKGVEVSHAVDLEHLHERMTFLENIKIRNFLPSVENLRDLAKFQSLKKLEFSCIHGLNAERLSVVPDLQELKFGYCNDLTDTALSAGFSGRTKLTTLYIKGCSITGEALSSLPDSVKHLSLSYCRNLTDAAFEQAASKLAKVPDIRTHENSFGRTIWLSLQRYGDSKLKIY